MYVSLSNLIRWGGLVALIAAVLLIIADLVTVGSVLGQGSMEGLIFRAALSASAGVLLALGLVSLYAPQTEPSGLPRAGRVPSGLHRLVVGSGKHRVGRFGG